MKTKLSVKNLVVSYHTPAGKVQAVRDISFDLREGESLAIVGESGSGKSAAAKAVMGLLSENAVIEAGSVFYEDRDLLQLSEKEFCCIRGDKIAMILQDTVSSLNPVMKAGKQLTEIMRLKEKMPKKAAKQKAIKLMEEVGIWNAEKCYHKYPFMLSGGMCQRLVIAIALAADPDILICDEPTAALDVTTQAQILELLHKLKEQRKLSVLFITHDMGVVANMADRVAVMYAGKIVETGTCRDIFGSPAHPYTWALLKATPDLETTGRLEPIYGTPPDMISPPVGDAFAERNPYALKIDYEMQPPVFQISKTHEAAAWLLHPKAPEVELPVRVKEQIARKKTTENTDGSEWGNSSSVPQKKDVLLRVEHLCKYFGNNKAVDDISFEVGKGEVFGLVGESGCGKTTTGRCIKNLCDITSGNIYFKGEPITQKRVGKAADKNRSGSRIQMVFQDPVSSLNPRMTVRQIIGEGLIIRGEKDKKEIDRKVYEAMELVGLIKEQADRYPHEFSGGQRQRIGVARAMIMQPELLIADEPVSALDASVQAQVINLFNDLRHQRGLSILFIAHDLAVVKYFADRIGVMYRGRLVEMAGTEELFARPLHPYTKALLSAIPLPEADCGKYRMRISYNPLKAHDYSVDFPAMQEVLPGHFVYCNQAELEKYRENHRFAEGQKERKSEG